MSPVPVPESDVPNDLVGWAVYLVTVLSAILVAGWRAGKMKATVDADIAAVKSSVTSIQASVCSLQATVTSISSKDLVEDEEIKHFITRSDLEKEQSSCRRERRFELDNIQNHNDARMATIILGQEHIQTTLKANAEMGKALCDEIRILREALLRTGVEIRAKERLGDVL